MEQRTETAVFRVLVGLALLYFFVVPLFVFAPDSAARGSTARLYGDVAAVGTILCLAWIAATAFHDVINLVKARRAKGSPGFFWSGFWRDLSGDVVLLLEAAIAVAFLVVLILGYPFRLFQ
jgi:hypothetical protein